MRKLLLLGFVLLFLFISCTKEEEATGVSVSNEQKNFLSEEEAWKMEPMYGKEILIGYNGGLCTCAGGLAKVLGYFEKEGLNVKITNIQTLDTIGLGKVNFLTDHIASLLVPTVNGMDMVFTTGAHTGCKSLYVLDNGKINTTKDLIGKTVAVHDGIGSSDHNIALRFFNHDNISPKEIKFRQVEMSASMFALESGQTDAAVFSDRFAEKFMQEGKIKIIRSLTFDEDFKKEPCCVHAFNKTFAKNNPITLKKMTKALKDVSYWIQDNIEEATQTLFDNNWASGDFDQAVRMMKTYNWTIGDDYTETALTNIIDDYKKFGLIAADKNTHDVLHAVWNPVLKN